MTRVEWGEKFENENCQLGTVESVVKGETLAMYRWQLPEGTKPKGMVLLLHGFRAYSLYNFLRNDDGVLRYGDETNSSIVRELHKRGLHVESHDHVGHGRTTGTRAYFPSIKALVEDSVGHAKRMRDEYPNIPLFLVGHSMGGTIGIIMSRDYPHLVDGACLSSAACEPPANMFGLKGRILASLSAIISSLFPTWEVLDLPKDEQNPRNQQLYENDPLNPSHVQCRARPGREFLVAYSDIAKHLNDFKTPVLAASGELDTLVDPDAAKRFIDGVSSVDKTLHVARNRWHNLIVEEGKEQIWSLYADWIAERCK